MLILKVLLRLFKIQRCHLLCTCHSHFPCTGAGSQQKFCIYDVHQDLSHALDVALKFWLSSFETFHKQQNCLQPVSVLRIGNHGLTILYFFTLYRNALNNENPPENRDLETLEPDAEMNGLAMETSCEWLSCILEPWGHSHLIVSALFVKCVACQAFVSSQEDDCMSVLASRPSQFIKRSPAHGLHNMSSQNYNGFLTIRNRRKIIPSHNDCVSCDTIHTHTSVSNFLN